MLQCAPGYFTPSLQLGSVMCAVCAAGTYQSKLFFAGTLEHANLFIIHDHCFGALPADETGKTFCNDCGYGVFSKEGGQICCPPGQSASETGFCVDCPVGTRWAGGSCEACGEGSYQDRTG